MDLRKIRKFPITMPQNPELTLMVFCQNEKARKHNVYGLLVKFDIHLAEKEDPQPYKNSLILLGVRRGAVSN